ncbi:MAG: oxidoreductase [Planctomycetaceae bacterium]|nr:oxidoreductase [Planctomycetaceae bacterium]
MNDQNLDRRDFVRAVGIAAAVPTIVSAGPTILGTRLGREDVLNVGLIGCGGRGSGAAVNALEAGPDVRIHAMADLFPDRLRSSLDNLRNRDAARVDVPESRQFTGFDAFQKVIGTDCDVVILATPPGFRPQHFAAAVEGGKHVFMEKPVAVDASGIRMVMEAAAAANDRKLSVVAGTQRRHEQCYLEAMERLHRGDLGRLLAARCYWNMGSLWNVAAQPDRSEVENQIRNWLYYTWLSGDHIVEQHVHNLDAINWAFQSPPTEVFGVGGRQSRTTDEYGHIFDHFGLEYRYPEDRFAMSMCRQQAGTAGRVEEVITGADGTATLTSGRAVLTGPKAWRFKGPQRSPYVQEHMDLQASIRGTGEYLNEGQRIAESTLTAIMGREAAYTGKVITFEDALNSDQDLMPDLMDFTDMPTPPVPVPGRTRMDRSDDVRPTDA